MKILMSSLMCMVLIAGSAIAQDEAEGGSTEDLAKAAQNPLSSMISLPFQNNINFDVDRYEVNKAATLFSRLRNNRMANSTGIIGAQLRSRYLGNNFRLRSRIFGRTSPVLEKHNRNQNILNIQPIYPITKGNWSFVNRSIIPIIYQPIGKDDSEFGLGDINHTTWMSPAAPGKLIWGVGPTISIPTATDDALGTGKWSAGPSVILLTMPGKWVIGGLASNVWSFAGDSDRESVNTFSSQIFVNYNLDNGWYLTSSPVITANWKADSDDRWTVPIGGGFGRIFKMGNQPVNAQVQLFYNVEKPDGAADWSLRFQLQFMFPKQKK